MFSVASAALLATSFVTYPGFGDQPGGRPAPSAEIETVIDKGPVAELIVACRPGTAILSYSKLERLYCGPRGGCSGSLARAIAAACR